MNQNRISQIKFEISQLRILAHSRFGALGKNESDEDLIKRQTEIYLEIDKLRKELRGLQLY